MRSVLIPALFAALLPAVASAATIDAALIPDGTYVVKVEKVQDAQHMLVVMQNGVEAMLSAKGSADFSKVKSDDTVKLSIVKGKVPVFVVQ
ncbi:MAG TPA: hypothetical protein VMA98_11490 [Candidatus Acidoferrales bacterium]|nr:hypothetical protein [Candidatus Acidoferrales bacterium]